MVDLLDSQPVLTPEQIALAEKMAAETLNPLAAMIKLMLPRGLSQQADTEYALGSIQPSAMGKDLSQTQKRIVHLIQKRGVLRGRQIDAHFKHIDWRKSAEALVRRGVLTRKSILPKPKIGAKCVRTAQLAVEAQTALTMMTKLGSTEQTQTRRAAALRFLVQVQEAVAVSWVYAESGCNLSDLKVLAKKDLITLRETENLARTRSGSRD